MQQSEFGTLGKIDAVSTVGREGNVVTIWSILARSGAEALEEVAESDKKRGVARLHLSAAVASSAAAGTRPDVL